MNLKVPKLNSQYCCIINSKSNHLGALISSYLSNRNEYLIFFEFHEVLISEDKEPSNEIDEYFISRSQAREFNILTKNAINRLESQSDKLDNLIIVGLSDNQKSFLKFLQDFNVIEVNDEMDVEIYFSAMNEKSGIIESAKENLVENLPLALELNKAIKIKESDLTIHSTEGKYSKLVVVENTNDVAVVIAMNYANSINAEIILIDPPEISIGEINEHIENWKKKGSEESFFNLSSKIYPNIEHIEFSKYRFCTFFTKGVPYALIVKNIIPSTHVNISIRPDFFIFNNIYFENNQAISSSIVFSPIEFGENEETKFVIDKLENLNHLVEPLVGEKSTEHELDLHLQLFPFQILHICSHGGEMNGSRKLCKFKDRDGIFHEVEFDEAASIKIERGQEKHQVTLFIYWRKFDNFIWKSKELKKQDYPHYVFADMVKEMRNFEILKEEKIDTISSSNAIKCKMLYYIPAFNNLSGGMTSPIIFNNTCWSWYNLPDVFINHGVRGYIGTLWNINNDIAKSVAESFYASIDKKPILGSLYDSLCFTKDTKDENVYIVWGLHFSTLKVNKDSKDTKARILEFLMKSHSIWSEKTRGNPNKNIDRYLRWLEIKIKSLVLTK